MKAESVEDFRRQRRDFIRVLYYGSGTDMLNPTPVANLADILGWSVDDVAKVVHFLAEQGLIEHHWDNQVTISRMGIEAAENLLSKNYQDSREQVPVTVLVEGDMIDSQIQTGGSNNRQSQSIKGIPNDSLQIFLSEFARALSDERFPSQMREETLTRLSSVEAQLQLEKPNKSALRESLQSLRSIAENLASSGIFQVLLELAKNIKL